MWVFACFRNFLHIQRWDFFFHVFVFFSLLRKCHKPSGQHEREYITDWQAALSASNQTKMTRQTRFLDSRAQKTSAYSGFYLYTVRAMIQTLMLDITAFFFLFHLPQSKTFSTVLFSRSYRAHVKNTTKNSLYFYNKIKILCLNITCASTNNIGPSTLQCVFKF